MENQCEDAHARVSTHEIPVDTESAFAIILNYLWDIINTPSKYHYQFGIVNYFNTTNSIQLDVKAIFNEKFPLAYNLTVTLISANFTTTNVYYTAGYKKLVLAKDFSLAYNLSLHEFELIFFHNERGGEKSH